MTNFGFTNYGRWKKVVQVSNGETFDATGSADGVAGFLMGTNPTGTASLYNGGDIIIDNLTNTVVHEFSIKQVTVNGGDHVYLLYDRKI